MLCGIIHTDSYTLAVSQVLKGNREADALELRLDRMQALKDDEIKQLRQASLLPVIFTLRSQQQGGGWVGREEARLKRMFELAELQPDFFDIEYDTDSGFIKKFSETYPHVKIIASYHNFEETPENIEELFTEMVKKFPSATYKIATFARDASDSLRLLSWVKEASERGYFVIGACMGEDGTPTRILGPIFGSLFCYTFFDEPSAPGQLPLHLLAGRFRYRSLTPLSRIYGVIGDPVATSKGEMTHNAVFHTLGIDAVYVKFRVPSNKLGVFFREAYRLGISGLSVTMPLKEEVSVFLTQPSPDAPIGAINTLALGLEGTIGINTDGRGALNAIEKVAKVQGKSLYILGAGGAARAIAYEAARRGADVKLFNRDEARARRVVQEIGSGAALPLEAFRQWGQQGDFLVQSTSVGMPMNPGMPVPEEWIPSNKVVLECVHAVQETLFMKSAMAKGCIVLPGAAMYVEQAVEQSRFWEGVDPQTAYEIIRQAYLA